MAEIIKICVLLIIGLSFLCYKKSKELSKQIKLKWVAAWCVTVNSGDYRHNLGLPDYVSNEQNNLLVLSKYRIANDEWEIVEIILANFQKELIQKYFCDSLYLPKSKHKIDGKIYFMYLLHEYLDKHHLDHFFLGYSMHKETISRTDYGMWGGQLYDATYALTDFAVIFYKLYYIAYLSCKKSIIFNSNDNHFNNNNETTIENIIDSRKISISRV